MDWLSAEQKGWIFDRNFYISSFAKKYFLESIRIILDGDRLSVHSEKKVRVLTAGVSWTGMYPACHMCEHF